MLAVRGEPFDSPEYLFEVVTVPEKPGCRG